MVLKSCPNHKHLVESSIPSTTKLYNQLPGSLSNVPSRMRALVIDTGSVLGDVAHNPLKIPALPVHLPKNLILRLSAEM